MNISVFRAALILLIVSNVKQFVDFYKLLSCFCKICLIFYHLQFHTDEMTSCDQCDIDIYIFSGRVSSKLQILCQRD